LKNLYSPADPKSALLESGDIVIIEKLVRETGWNGWTHQVSRKKLIPLGIGTHLFFKIYSTRRQRRELFRSSESSCRLLLPV